MTGLRWIVRGVGAGLVVVLAAGLLNGCKGADSSGPKKIKLAAINFQDDQFFRLILCGMRDAARKAGVEILEGNSANKPEKEIELINTYLARKVDAILISPISAKSSGNALRAARDKGIPIIIHNTKINDDTLPFVECDPGDLGKKTGQACRQYVQDKLGGKAKIAIIGFRSQFAEQSDARTNGFKSQFSDQSGVQFLGEQEAWETDKAVARVGDVLTANPDIKIIYAANEGGTAGSVLAVKAAGKAGKIVVFGTDASEQLLGFLQDEDNILQAITSQQPVKVGQTVVELAMKAIRKEKIEPRVISMEGILLSREDPQAVRDFAKQLKEWTAMGSK